MGDMLCVAIIAKSMKPQRKSMARLLNTMLAQTKDIFGMVVKCFDILEKDMFIL